MNRSYVDHEEVRDDPFVKQLADKINTLKQSKAEEADYVKFKGLSDDERWEAMEEGRQEGKEEERLQSLRQLIKNLGWTAEKAMEAIGIPLSEQSLYSSRLSRE